MNKTINEIINNYTSGKTPVEDTNKALKEAGAGFSFQPGKNALTAGEIAATKVGARPGDVTGYGLMSSGTGTMDKVHVVKGRLQGGAVNRTGKGVQRRPPWVFLRCKTAQLVPIYLPHLAANIDDIALVRHTIGADGVDGAALTTVNTVRN